MNSDRRFVLRGALATVGTALLHRAAADTPAEPRVIEIVARRFVYEPDTIPLKVGERVVVAVKSLDFVHGMNIPDLGKRFDLVPGRVTRFELQPQAPGAIEFVCDNFCGEGHEQMHGKFEVSA